MAEKQGKQTRIIQYGIWISFLIAFIPRMILVLTCAYPLSVAGDELFGFMPIAKLLGWDWSGVMENYRYYGFGFFVFLTPLFKWIENPLVLYRVIVAIFALLQSLSAPLSYMLMKKYFKLDNEWFLTLSSIACSYFVTLRAVYVYNEHVYIFVTWIVAWLLLLLNKNVDSKKKRRVYTLLLMLILIYALTIHARGVTLWLALGVAVIYYLIAYKKWLVSWPIVLSVGGVGYVLYKIGMDLMLHTIWNAGAAETVSNTSVSFSIAGVFQSLKALTGWVYIMLGQLNTVNMFTGGFAIIAIVIGITFLFKQVIPRYVKTDMTEINMNSKYAVILVFMLAAAAITILGQSFSWLGGVTAYIEGEGDVDAMRAVTYLRYFGAYFGPVIMAILAYVYQNKQAIRGLLYPIISTGVLLQAFWITCILPNISGFNGTAWEYAPYSFTQGWWDEIRFRAYIPACLLTVILLIILCWLLYKKKVCIVAGILCVVLMYQYGFNSIYHEGERGRVNYEYVENTYQLLDELQDSGVLPKEIYVENHWVYPSGQETRYLYQFLMKENTVICGEPGKGEDGLFITSESKRYKTLIEKGYRSGKIDDNNMIYVKGNELQEAVQSWGVKLDSF